MPLGVSRKVVSCFFKLYYNNIGEIKNLNGIERISVAVIMAAPIHYFQLLCVWLLACF